MPAIADKINQICVDLDSQFQTQSLYTLNTPAGPILYKEFQFIAPEDVAKIVGSVWPSTCSLDPCPSWLIKLAREELKDWLWPIGNSSL